jgi:mannose-6-phosphate isomerase-like protein (cupin superfamily)
MFIALLFSLLLAQAPAPPKAAAPKPQPATPPKAAPAQPRPQAARPAAAAVSGMAITVTDGKGTPFADVSVQLTGAASNSGKTNSAGQLSFPGLRAGTYRLRFSGEGVVAFEREVTLKAGEIAKLPIALTAAEPPAPVAAAAPPPPAPAPAALVVGPSGAPQIGSLSSLAERERRTKERREILLSCSGNTRNVLLVLTGEQAQRVYDAAEVTYYVVEGQGSAQVGGLASVITEGSFVAIPRGTPFALAQKGNRPLTLLWTLSGEPCEQAR